MASKRKLKKEFIKLAKQLFDEGLLFRHFAQEESLEKCDTVLDDILVWTDDVIRRIGRPDGSKDSKLVRAYYRALRSDINQKSEEFDTRLTDLLESL